MRYTARPAERQGDSPGTNRGCQTGRAAVPLMHMRTSLLPAAMAALMLLGAGCGDAPETPAANAPGTDAPVTADRPPVDVPVTDVPPAMPPGQEVRALPAATGVDETWETYTNRALGFTFRAPTRGRYAPTWEVTFVAEGDAAIVDGCYQDGAREDRTSERLSTDGVTFCRSFSREGAAGSVFLTQHVVTKMGPRYAHLAFTKKATNAGMLECPTPPASGLSVSSEACVPFALDEFDAQIEAIIATFRLVE